MVKITILDIGLNKIRDLHDSNIDKCWMGTDGSAVTASQTTLVAGVSASKIANTSTTADKTLVINYTLLSTVATGNTFREFAVILDGDTEYTRVTLTGIAHTSTDDIVVRQTFFYRNP